MDKKLEVKISETFRNSRVKELDERIGDGMVGRLSRELNEVKKKRDDEIAKAIFEITNKYKSEIEAINKKILSKAKLLEN